MLTFLLMCVLNSRSRRRVRMLLNELALYTIYSSINEKFEIHLNCRAPATAASRIYCSALILRWRRRWHMLAWCPRVLITLSYCALCCPVFSYLDWPSGSSVRPRTCSINLFALSPLIMCGVCVCVGMCVAQLRPPHLSLSPYHNNNAWLIGRHCAPA